MNHREKHRTRFTVAKRRAILKWTVAAIFVAMAALYFLA